jgi:ABC-type uncharacterized transport system permease subunit
MMTLVAAYAWLVPPAAWVDFVAGGVAGLAVSCFLALVWKKLRDV